MKIEVVSKKTTPLCFLPDGDLVCYQTGYIVTMRDGKEKLKFPIKLGNKEKWLGWSCFATRLLRLGIRTAIALDDSNIIISIGNKLHEFDIGTGLLSEGWYCGEGIRPLVYSNVRGISGFKDGIYFGGYLGNMEKNPVEVYRRIGVDQGEGGYTIHKGTINHVHNIVADTYRNCLWVFTGDFDESAAIWKVTDNFKNIECIACNDQKYRACVVYALPEGLLYATDTPFEKDYIYLFDTHTHELNEIFPIDGSCIYGCQWGGDFVFSSTVEPDGRNTSKIDFYLGRMRGPGINDNYVHLYCGNLRNGFKEIYREEKDKMPYFTFQFGVFRFPSGVNSSNMLYFQSIATKKNDLKMMAFSYK